MYNNKYLCARTTCSRFLSFVLKKAKLLRLLWRRQVGELTVSRSPYVCKSAGNPHQQNLKNYLENLDYNRLCTITNSKDFNGQQQSSAIN